MLCFCLCLLLGVVSYNTVFFTGFCGLLGVCHERECVRLQSRSVRSSHDGLILLFLFFVDVIGLTARPASIVDVFVLFVVYLAATV